jgi:hypothetical protein
VSDSSLSISSSTPSSSAPSNSTSGSGTPAQGTTTGAGGPSPDGPDLREQGMLFRSLLESPLTARQWADFSSYRSLQDLSHDQGGDASAMLQGQGQALIDPGPGFQPAAAAAAPGGPDPAIAELIERHIRRALASVDAESQDGEIRIELSDAVFPGTALTLKRTADGWQLTATADNRQSLDELNHFAPDLVERFEKASLGRLHVTLAG